MILYTALKRSFGFLIFKAFLKRSSFCSPNRKLKGYPFSENEEKMKGCWMWKWLWMVMLWLCNGNAQLPCRWVILNNDNTHNATLSVQWEGSQCETWVSLMWCGQSDRDIHYCHRRMWDIWILELLFPNANLIIQTVWASHSQMFQGKLLHKQTFDAKTKTETVLRNFFFIRMWMKQLLETLVMMIMKEWIERKLTSSSGLITPNWTRRTFLRGAGECCHFCMLFVGI